MNTTNPVANFDFNIDDLSNEQKELYHYWVTLKGSRLMPTRAEFNPADVVKVLPFISMENVSYNPVRFQVRLVGTKTLSLQNSIGTYLDEIVGTDEIIDMLKEMVSLKKPYIYSSDVKWNDRSFKTYSSLIVPFSEDGENVTLAMACHHTLATTKFN